MPNYNVYLGDEIIGSVNLSNCNCSKFMYLGTDLSGNTMVYKPGLHTIKECLLNPNTYNTVSGDTCESITIKKCPGAYGVNYEFFLCHTSNYLKYCSNPG